MRILVVVWLALSLLAGCSRVPEPVGYQYTAQPKMQAAYHWVVLASDVANRINNELILNDYARKPVYVKTTCGNEDTPCAPHETSTFNEAFRDLLITELVRFGVPVRQQENEDAIIVHYKVQLVYHNTRRLRSVHPGFITAIATGIQVLRNAPSEIQTIAAAGLVDFMNSSAVNISHHEIIITTSMVAKGRYLFRSSDLYYINDKDFNQYQDTGMRQAAEIPLVSPHSSGKTVKPSNNAGNNTTVKPAPLMEDGTVIPDI